jgi:hypothetical protein
MRWRELAVGAAFLLSAASGLRAEPPCTCDGDGKASCGRGSYSPTHYWCPILRNVVTGVYRRPPAMGDYSGAHYGGPPGYIITPFPCPYATPATIYTTHGIR